MSRAEPCRFAALGLWLCMGCSGAQEQPKGPQTRTAAPPPSIDTRSTTLKASFDTGRWTRRQVADEGGAEVTLRLVADKGVAALAMPALLRSAEDPRVACRTHSDDKGVARVPEVMPGHYEFVVLLNGLETLSIPFELGRGATRELHLELSAADWSESTLALDEIEPCLR